MEKREFFPQLESLRGIAALLVVFTHIGWSTPISEQGLVRNGYSMVDFFFVLSGFVICHSYGDRLLARIDVRRFVWLRFWRLYPLHFAMLAVFVALEFVKLFAGSRLGGPTHAAFSENDPMALVANLFLVHALGSEGTTFNWPSWSISAELFAYLSFVLVCLALRSQRQLLAGSCLIAITAASTLIIKGETDLTTTVQLGFFRCLFGFYSGVAVCLIIRMLPKYRTVAFSTRKWLRAIAILGCVVLYQFKSSSYADFFAVPLVALLIFVMADTIEDGPSRFLRSKPLMWLGTVSYSIYMVHAVVTWSMLQIVRLTLHPPAASTNNHSLLILGDIAGTAFLVLTLVIVLAASAFTYRFIELPFRDWSRRVLHFNHKTAPAAV